MSPQTHWMDIQDTVLCAYTGGGRPTKKMAAVVPTAMQMWMKALFNLRATERHANTTAFVRSQNSRKKNTFGVGFLLEVVIFSGILNGMHYTDILDGALIPFIEGHYPTSHCFQ